MVVLALDTTTRTGSCALVRDGRVLRERASDPATSPAEHLPGDLIAVLADEGLDLHAIDVLAVAIGPGSFTGLRVGIATMQGLAFAMRKPLLGVSALDALARIAGPGLVATWIDAWRGEVYAALYEGGREVEAASVEHPAALLARRADDPDRPRPVYLGDGAASFANTIAAAGGALADPVSPLIAGAIGRIAHDRARAGEEPPPDAIRPLYVRRTDAELARDARSHR